MMLTERKIWLMPFIFLLAIWLGGCSMQYSDEELRAMQGEDEGICLILNISAGDLAGFGTRTVEEPDRFEQATIDTEKIQSMRIIIVDVQPGSKTENKVVHNYFTGLLSYARFDLSGIMFDNLNFSSQYRIYLIANENGLPEPIRNKFKYDVNNPDQGLPPGAEYPANLLENIILYSKDIGSGNFLMNNESSSSPIAIPMTEIFNVTTDPRPDNNSEDVKAYMERNFFITRTASKFSFRFYRGGDLAEDLELKRIKISGVGKQEFLFPNNTEYNPSKYSSNNNPLGGREITSFDLPDGSETGAYTFSLSQKLSSIGNDGMEYTPQIYFSESKGDNGKFECALSFDGENYTSAITLPNLSELPRNTTVIINITFHEIGFEISVKQWVSGGRTEIDVTE